MRFFGALALFLGFANLYIYRRAVASFRLSVRARRILAAGLAAGFGAMALGRIGQRVVIDGSFYRLFLAGNVVELGVVLSAVILAVLDIARSLGQSVFRVAQLVAIVRRRGAPAPALAAVEAPVLGSDVASTPDEEAAAALEAPRDGGPACGPRVERGAPEAPALPRRRFLAEAAAASAFALGGGTAAYGVLIGRTDYITEEIPIPIPGLPRALDGFVIVQLSDIHLGLMVGERETRAAEELVRKARPDLVVLTGDLIDHDPAYAGELGRFTRRLAPLAREGVAAIPGNHDYYTGIDRSLAAAAEGGADVLMNRGRVIQGGFALLGVDDVWGRRMRSGAGPDLARAIASVPQGLPRVLLCHNPVFFPEAASEVALQLSGHTHGGQVNPGVRPADLLLPHGYVAGLYQRSGSRLYVNRGFGTAGPPARIGAPPEVTRIVLVSV